MRMCDPTMMPGCINADDQRLDPPHWRHSFALLELASIAGSRYCSGRSLAALAWIRARGLERETWLIDVGWILMCCQVWDFLH
jgi:hypothetical protein